MNTSSLASENCEIGIYQKSSDIKCWEVGKSFILGWKKNYLDGPANTDGFQRYWRMTKTSYRKLSQRNTVEEVHSRTRELWGCKLCCWIHRDYYKNGTQFETVSALRQSLFTSYSETIRITSCKHSYLVCHSELLK